MTPLLHHATPHQPTTEVRPLRRSLGLATAALAVVALAASPAAASDAATAPNGTSVSLTGKVVKATPDAFRLDYGDGVMTIEMDDFDFEAEGTGILMNDEVTVYGVVDDDLFEKRTIEASSVYDRNLGTVFYASPIDEEDFGEVPTSLPAGEAEFKGVVTNVDGRRFTLDSGPRMVHVDTSEMAINPMDDKGYLKVEKGDIIKARGQVDTSLFVHNELHAMALFEYRDAQREKKL